MSIPVTLREQIETVEGDDISYRALHSIAYISDADTGDVITVPYMDLISKYSDFLDAIVVEMTLTDELYFRYRYRPKTLSNDLYGTTELWFTLLNLNGFRSIMEFQPKKLKYYDPDQFKIYINEIMVLEEVLN